MRVDVSNYPEEWKTDKNLRWWLSKREDESVMVPDEIWVREDEAVEFAKQFHAPEIKKLETLLKLERRKFEYIETEKNMLKGVLSDYLDRDRVNNLSVNIQSKVNELQEKINRIKKE